MKKLMIAAAIVCAAAMSQAATVAWGGAISQPDGMTELAANTSAYLVYSTSAISGAATFDGTDLFNGSDAVIASVVSTHTITGTEASNWEFLENYDKSGSDVNGFYAVLISDMNADPMYSIYNLDEITGTTATSPTTNRQIAWDNYLTSGGYTIAAAGGAAVPEPTSGLMLLLGVAGLALKRKRA